VRPYLEKSLTKIGLVKWPKVKALSSSLSTAKKKKKKKKSSQLQAYRHLSKVNTTVISMFLFISWKVMGKRFRV
jgi:hypothetical protein